MSFALALMLGAAVPAQASPLSNLDFRSGLRHWEGEGFAVTTGTGRGPGLECGVTSGDNGRPGRAGLLYRTFVVPPGTGAIRFTAAAARAPGCKPGPALDVLLEAPGRTVIPRQVRTPTGLKVAPALAPLRPGRLQEYYWPVSAYAGQTVRIVIFDEDRRPGCFVFSSGFRLLSTDEFDVRLFAERMHRLERQHGLAPLTRVASKHFLALSNAADEYTEHRLYNCETIYRAFFDHFRRKGFAVRPPAGKMLVAIFDSQAGFEAYLGHRASGAVTGVYHIPSNCLVVYDYASNRGFAAGRRRAREFARRIPTDADRQRVLGAYSQKAQEFRADLNTGTIMHEVAHQLSFNGGLLNREGDVPLWLGEGLACYCEPTTNGDWLGIGERNPMRAGTLAGPARGRGAFIPLRSLVASDDWLRKARRIDQAVLGYAQGWALFRMLMEERPQALRQYLARIYHRQTPDRRLADFTEAFGDLGRLERRYQAYMREVVRQQARESK